MYDQGDTGDDLRSSFTTYLAEGDKLFMNGEFSKALESYTKALMLKPGDKSCLVARSKCYLHIGDPVSALKDADECIKDDKQYHKGLYQRAEALYQMGQFEHGLIFFHRGHALRPELDQFRLGIQKCQEAIENSVGGPSVIELDPNVELPIKTEQPLDFRSKRNHKETIKKVASDKAAKTLLGELYVDRQYLEQLSKDEILIKEENGKCESILELINTGIKYLDTRTDFWRQQKPMYTRKREKSMLKPITSEQISLQIEAGLKALANGDFEAALREAADANKTIDGQSTNEKRKSPHVLTLQADANSLYGKALLELGRIEEAIVRHKTEIQVAKRSGIDEIKIRAMDNLAEAYVKNGDYEKAIRIYVDRMKSIKSGSENAWINHNWGRCLLEQGHFDQAEAKGTTALKAAKDANDRQWQLNAKVLIAQAQIKQGRIAEAEKSFKEAAELAESVVDEMAKNVIQTQLAEIQKFNENQIEPTIE
jgi:pentatricopeptide repeat protein